MLNPPTDPLNNHSGQCRDRPPAKQLASMRQEHSIEASTSTIMKTLLPKYAILLAIVALGMSNAAGQTLEQQKEAAAKLAAAQGTSEEKAETIARDLGDAFGPGENSDALLQAVEQMAAQSPDDAAAIAAAATAFNPTPEFATRVAQAASRAAPSSASAIAAAVSSAVPSADSTAVAQAAQQGAQEGTATSGGGGGESGSGGGSPPLPTGFGGGGGSSTSSSGDS